MLRRLYLMTKVWSFRKAHGSNEVNFFVELRSCYILAHCYSKEKIR